MLTRQIRFSPVHCLSRLRNAGHAFSRELSGIAAVEFALLLPIMLLLFIAGGEMAQATLTSRNVDALARTLADIGSRQSTCATTASQCEFSSTPGAGVAMSQATMESFFNAASAVMVSAPLANLTMTLTAVDVQGKPPTSTTCCSFQVRWSYGQSGSASVTPPLRACNVNSGAGLTPVNTSLRGANPITPSYTNIDQNLNPAYTNGSSVQVTPPTGAILIADVTYKYTPPLVYGGSAIVGAVNFAPTMTSTRYVLPRATGQVILSLPAGIGATTSNPVTTMQNSQTVYQNGVVCY